MRSNRGGLLDQAQTVSELFINNGTIFSTQGRHPDSRRTYKSAPARRWPRLPIVVLMNGGSASAAEIVAAALQDRGRAVVVGSTSYGKGTVQTVVRLANEGELILTWSRLQAPSGYTWNELGVLPNICTAKVGDVGQLGADSVDSSQGTLMRWHALRNPTQQEVSTCARSARRATTSPERDVEIATRLLHDRDLYAHAVQAATQQAAAASPARPSRRLTRAPRLTKLARLPGIRPSGHRDKTMAKPTSILIKMMSSADTGYFYVTKKNPRTKTEKCRAQEVRPRRAQARRVQGIQDQVTAFPRLDQGRPSGRLFRR